MSIVVLDWLIRLPLSRWLSLSQKPLGFFSRIRHSWIEGLFQILKDGSSSVRLIDVHVLVY